MKKLSICMTHYNRKFQLLNTLRSIEIQKVPKEFFEIIIVDDVSNTTPLHISDFETYDLDIKLISIQTKYKWWVNPCVGFNTAFNFINGAITIIQNAECLHGTTIIDYVLNNLQENEYIAMSALNLTEHATKSITASTSPNEIDVAGAQWYCHSIHKPNAFNFCAAIHTVDLKRVGGFDPRFAEGISYDDDMFLHSLSQNNIDIKIEDSQLVFHQWHERVWESVENFNGRLQKNLELLTKNKG
jgi:glycosyltransferase involved in cell wall biosynthesis